LILLMMTMLGDDDDEIDVLYIIYNQQQTLTFVDLLQVLKSYNIILSSEKSSWWMCSCTVPHVERRN